MLSQLSPHLFWDTDFNLVHEQEHKAFIIKRVLEYGLWNDWLLIQKYYTIQNIAEEVKNFRELEPRALNFVATIAGIPKEEFRCYITRHSSSKLRDLKAT